MTQSHSSIYQSMSHSVQPSTCSSLTWMVDVSAGNSLFIYYFSLSPLTGTCSPLICLEYFSTIAITESSSSSYGVGRSCWIGECTSMKQPLSVRAFFLPEILFIYLSMIYTHVAASESPSVFVHCDARLK